MKTLKEKYSQKKIINENDTLRNILKVKQNVDTRFKLLRTSIKSIKEHLPKSGKTYKQIVIFEKEAQSFGQNDSWMGDITEFAKKNGGKILGYGLAGIMGLTAISTGAGVAGILCFAGLGGASAIGGSLLSKLRKDPITKATSFATALTTSISRACEAFDTELSNVTEEFDKNKPVKDIIPILFAGKSVKEKQTFIQSLEKSIARKAGAFNKKFTAKDLFEDFMNMSVNNMYSLSESLESLNSFLSKFKRELTAAANHVKAVTSKNEDEKNTNKENKIPPIKNARELSKYLTQNGQTKIEDALNPYSIKNIDKFYEFSNFLFDKDLIGS